MEQYRNTEILPGVKAIYRSGDLIYRDPAPLNDDTPERTTEYDEKNQISIEYDDDMY